MLFSLHIENIAVIRKLDIDFSHGFSALTGETGAGKSMLIDSVNFLLGGKVQRELIRTGETSACVSALFGDLTPAELERISALGLEADEGELLIQRTMQAGGRQSVHVNGQAVSLAVLRELGKALLNIHGQNDNQLLLQKDTHRALLDTYAHNEAILASYREAYAEWRAVEKELSELNRDEAETLRMKEMLAFQIKDIESVAPKPSEEKELSAECDKLTNIEKIAKQSDLIWRMLYGSEKGATALVERSGQLLRQLAAILPEAEPLAERLQEVRYTLADVAEWARSAGETEYEDPSARIDKIQSRLDALAKLKRKYGPDEEAVLRFRDEVAAKLEKLEDSHERTAELLMARDKKKKMVLERAADLTATRVAAAGELQNAVLESLSFLDMPKVRFEVGFKATEPGPDGTDDPEFLIATNPSEPLLPMIRIASGGELSRIMLAVKSVLSDRDGVGCVIYDEVDTGVSGKTSRKVGIKLQAIAAGTQVICVTHSAQIASLADHHFLIRKEENDGRAETHVTELTDQERVDEIARILGGIQVTENQKLVAREMIEEGRREKPCQ